MTSHHEHQVRRAAQVDHTSCASANADGRWSTAECGVCGKRILVPAFVPVGSALIGVVFGLLAALVVWLVLR